MRKKRIAVLHAQVPFTWGGAEYQVQKLTDNLVRRGYETELIQIPFKWYPKNSLLDSMYLWRMVDLSEANGKRIDMVIPTKFPTYGVNHDNKVMWLVHQHRAAYDLYDNQTHFGFGTIEHGEEMRQSVYSFDNVVIRESKKIFSESKTVSDRLYSYNGIDSEPLYHPPAFAGRYICGEYGSYILSAGRLDPLKRLDLLIKSLPFCDKSIRLIITGIGSDQDALVNLVEKTGLTDRVDFAGFVTEDELIQLYANAFAVYFAPVDEDYGYITLEAFLSQKPIVTCRDSGGVLEFARHEENALICEPQPEQIGEAFSRLYNNKSLCEELGNTGKLSISNINWDNVVDKFVAFL